MLCQLQNVSRLCARRETSQIVEHASAQLCKREPDGTLPVAAVPLQVIHLLISFSPDSSHQPRLLIKCNRNKNNYACLPTSEETSSAVGSSVTWLPKGFIAVSLLSCQIKKVPLLLGVFFLSFLFVCFIRWFFFVF